ncbi:MAG: AAA family ATPase [Actinomycetota bacterium]
MSQPGKQIETGGAPTGSVSDCPSCGTPNPEPARFCSSCGIELPDGVDLEPPAAPEPRAVAVVAVLLDATGDGAERARRRAEVRIRATLQRHGGATIAVEGGSAAVFGLHPTHGDGALRAARAAEEVRDALARESETRVSGGSLAPATGRISVTIEQTVTTDVSEVPLENAVALAERAEPGEVLLGPEAHRRAGPASVEAEPTTTPTPSDAPAVAERADADTEGTVPDDVPDPASDDAEEGATLADPDEADPLEALESALEDEDDDHGEGGDENDENRERDEDAATPGDADDLGHADDLVDAGVDDEEAEVPMRLVRVVEAGAGQAPTPRAPLVGRDAERVALRELFERAVESRSCVAVTVVGSPGIGKSRLAEALIAWAESSHDATAIRVRCRDAAEGGAAWPVAELIEQAIGVVLGDGVDDARADLERVLSGAHDASVVIERLAHMLALPGGRALEEETPWALRRLLEVIASERPIVLLVDDADGTDPSFARLLRSVADRMSAPMLLLATGRSDPLHGTAEENIVAAITLEPLDGGTVAELLEQLVGRTALGERAQQRVATATGGNPFLIEQLTCMLIEEGLLRWDEGRWLPTTDLSAMPTPPNVAALLDARLQGITTEERTVLERIAVVGERPRWDAVLAAVPDELRLAAGDHVAALRHKQLLRSTDVPGDDIVRFHHPFVRDAAVRGATGVVRAQVHAAIASWLVVAAGDRSDRFDELLGAHLERAYRTASANGSDAHVVEAARSAAAHLEGAGERAGQLGDAQGAFQLAQRAASLVARDDPHRPELLLRAAIALADLDQLPRADALLTETAHAARAAGERAVEWRAKILRARLAAAGGQDHRALENARRRADRSVVVFRDLGDDWGLAWAWSLSAYVSLCRGHASAYAAAAGRAAEAARRAGRKREEAAALRDLARALGEGPAPLDEVAARLASIVDRVGDELRPVAQEALGVLATVHADRGHPDEARAADERAASIAADLGLEREFALRAERSGAVQLLTGDVEGAQVTLREGLEIAERAGDGAAAARIAATLAHVLEDAGNYGEAVRLTEVAEQGGAPHDVTTRVRWRTARARALAHGGNLAQANALAREAVRLADQTDAVELRATALIELAEVLRLSGRRNEAMPLVRRALRAFSRKGASVRAARARRLLAELDPASEPVDDTPAVPGTGPSAGSPGPATASTASSGEVAYASVAPGVAPVEAAVPAVPNGTTMGTQVVEPTGVPAQPQGAAPSPGAGAAAPVVRASNGDPAEPFGASIEQEFAALQEDAPGPDPRSGSMPTSDGATLNEESEQVAPAPTESPDAGADKGKGRKGLRFW